MSTLCYRILSERYLPSEIDIVQWNPKYDLLAIATKRGDLILQRLFWKKAWHILAKSVFNENENFNEICIRTLSWSPNGKYLAVVYSTGKIIFVEVESGRICHKIAKETEIRDNEENVNDCMISRWIESGILISKNTQFDDINDSLISLPPFDKSKSAGAATTASSFDIFTTGSSTNEKLSLFIVSNGRDSLRLFVNGFFHLADLSLSHFVQIRQHPATSHDRNKIIPNAFDLTSNFDRLGVAYVVSESEIRFALFNTPLAFQNANYWFSLTKHIVHLSAALSYVELAMQKILDSWEDSVGDLDSKLTKYAIAKANSTETIGDDFLQMLVFGIASPDLEHFVTRTLTDKGLKKLSTSIENSYSNLFNLSGVNLDRGMTALYHHLTTLRNLLVDDGDTVWNDVIESIAGMALKFNAIYNSTEMNARSIGLFVRWLHRCLLTISEENVPSNLGIFSDDDMDEIAKFIERTFCKSVDNSQDESDAPTAAFGLEKFGNFLKSESTWTDDFMTTTSNLLIPHKRLENFTLPICIKLVNDCVTKILNRISEIFSQRFEPIEPNIFICDCGPENISKSICLVHDSQKQCFRIFFSLNTADQLVISEFNDRSASLMASWKLSDGIARKILNLDLYNTGIVTALVREKAKQDEDWKYILYQIDTNNLRAPSSPSKYTNRSETQLMKISWNVMNNQVLTDGQFCHVAVTGTRKVGCVVFTCRTRLKLLEMEPTDEDTIDMSAVTEDNSAIDME